MDMFDNEEDETKFDEIVEFYEKFMHHVANNILKDSINTEDAVQKSFLKIIKHIKKIEVVNSSKAKGFIFVITKNTAIDLYRKENKHLNQSLEEIKYEIRDRSAEFEDEITNDEPTALDRALKKLPVNYATVLLLKYKEGYADAEVGEMLGISEDNVRQRSVRGKKKLKTILQEEKGKANEKNNNNR